MRTAKIVIEVEVDQVPDHITDTQVLDALRSLVGWNRIVWPEPQSYVRTARLIERAVRVEDTPAEDAPAATTTV